LRQIRDQFLAAKKNPALLQVFVNTILGEPWSEAGEAPDWERLYGRRGPHPRNFVPRDGLVLTAAADIQRDRIEVEIRAWGENFRSWSIDHRVIPGDPAQLTGPQSPWLALDALLSESWEHELGGRIAISKLGVDSGDGATTQAVYAWSRKYSADRVVPIKGSATASVLVSPPKLIDTTAHGQKIHNGAVLSIVGANLAKSELYGWLRQTKPEDPKEPLPTGWIHWPGDYEEEWFR
jgi:phage terminase large subunit GpA-like protein